MRLPKEEVKRIEADADEYSESPYSRQDYYTGATTEALRSLDEINRLKERVKELEIMISNIRLDFNAIVDKTLPNPLVRQLADFIPAKSQSKEESQEELWEELDQTCTDCNCSLIIEKATERYVITRKPKQ